MEILALIPARSGSKGIPHKNIATFRGKPLLAHSIVQARQSSLITRVIVSTDSSLYADISAQYGAEVPFLRPPEISGDFSTDLEVFLHALTWLKASEGYSPDICVHLRPTYPIRTPADIDKAIELLMSDPHFDSVRSVTVSPETPYKMWSMGPDGALSPVVECEIPEAYNQPRQRLPVTYLQNACIDVVWTRVILGQNSMTGRRIRGMAMEHLHDIDQGHQLQSAEAAGCGKMEGKRFVIDIDGVVASITPDNDYARALPLQHNIDMINRLFDRGNTIVLFTARGSATGIDWQTVTRDQMSRWRVKYHELLFGKPHADYYIDDRLISAEQMCRLFG